MKKNISKLTKLIAVVLIAVSSLTGCFQKKEMEREDSGKESTTKPESEATHGEEQEDAVSSVQEENGKEKLLVSSEEDGATIIRKDQHVDSMPSPDKGKPKDPLVTTEKLSTVDLEKLLDSIKCLVTSEYTPKSFKQLQQQAELTKEFLANEPKTQQSVNEMEVRLHQSIANLQKKADKKSLQTLMECISKLNGAVYTPKSFLPLTTAAIEAQGLLNDENATQDSITSIEKTLTTYLSSLIKRADTKLLQQCMTQASVLQKNEYLEEGYNRMISSLEKARHMVDNQNVSQQEVDELTQQLAKEMKDLVKYVVPDTRKLQQLIQQASSVDGSLWSVDSINVLQAELQKANSILATFQVLQQQVDVAYSTLSTAYSSLCVDYKELEETITYASTINLEVYTDASKNAFETTFKRANDFVKESHTQKEINEMASILLQSIHALEAIQELDKTQLKAELSLAMECQETIYTPTSYESLQRAIKQAQAVINDKKANENQISDAQTMLKQAREQLIQRANVAMLRNLISQGEQASKGTYLSDGLSILKNRLETATALIQNPEALQADVDSCCENLELALSSLIERGNKEVILNMISELSTLDSSLYTKNSVKQLQEVMKAVETSLEEAEISKEAEIDFAKRLQDAKKQLIEVSKDTSSVEEKIKLIQKMNLSIYTDESVLAVHKAIEEVETSIKTEELTSSLLQQMLDKLEVSINALQTKDTVATTLVARIQDAMSLDARVYESDNLVNLQSLAISQRKQLETSIVSNEDMKQMLLELETKFALLQVDTQALLSQVSEAIKIDQSKYTTETVAVLITSIEKANTLLERGHPNATELIQMLDELSTAIEQLIKVQDLNLIEQLLKVQQIGKNKTKDYIPNAFTDASYLRYAAASYEAERILVLFSNGVYQLTNEEDCAELSAVIQELNISIQELTLYDGIKPADQAYIDCLQTAIAKGQQALDAGGYDEMNAKTLKSKITSAQTTINNITNKITSIPHNDTGQQMIKDAVSRIEEAIKDLSKSVDIIEVDVQNEILQLLNTERTKAGLQELRFDEKLSQAATIRSKEMSRYLYLSEESFASKAHFRPNGTRFNTIAEEVSYAGGYLGENAAMGYTNATSLFNGWWNSAGHKANMMNMNFNEVGVALVKVGEGQYLAYMILGRSDEIKIKE